MFPDAGKKKTPLFQKKAKKDGGESYEKDEKPAGKKSSKMAGKVECPECGCKFDPSDE